MSDARSNRYALIYKNRPFKVLVCLVTLMAFLTNIVSYDLAWGVTPSNSSPFKELNISTFALPQNLGTVKDSYFSKTGRTIIHIQDAHCNYYAQSRIAEIIEYLNKEYGVNNVNLEGGAQGYDISIFTRIKDKSKRDKAADHFMKEGLVNGAEYFAINNPEKINLWGAEDVKLYIENLKVYRNSLKHKDEVDKYLKNLSYILSNLKLKIYSKELLELDSRYNAYKVNNADFKDYLSYLMQRSRDKLIDIKSYANIYLLSQTLGQEGDIDFRKANNERDELIDVLQKRLSRNALEELVVKTVEFKAEKISQGDFYEYLADKAKSIGLDLGSFPELKKYSVYVAMYGAIDKSKITEEVGELEDKLKNSLFRNDEDRQLDTLSKNLALTKNMFNISLTRDDYKYYKTFESSFEVRNFRKFIDNAAPIYKIDVKLDDDISALDGYRENMAKFYEYSFRRDKAFLKNINLKKTSIIVTGGFHTENLCDMFKKQGISYVSIIPNFKNCDGYECPYFKILSGQENINLALAVQAVTGKALAVPDPLNPAVSRAVEEEFGRTMSPVVGEVGSSAAEAPGPDALSRRSFLRKTLSVVAGAAVMGQFDTGLKSPAVAKDIDTGVVTQGRTFYVSASGNDSNPGTGDKTSWRSIQNFAKVAKPGDTLILGAGTYAGAVFGWDDRGRYGKLIGTASAPITIKADPNAPPGSVIINSRNDKTQDGIDFEPGNSYVIIEGLTVNNSTGSIKRAGIRITGSDHMIVRHNVTDRCGRWGIFTGFSDDVLIESNTASNSVIEHGIYVSNSADRPVIRGNVVFGNAASGIHLNGDASMGGDGIISEALIENNVIHDNGNKGAAINLDGVHDSVIRGNLLYNNHASGIALFKQNGAKGPARNIVVNNTVIMAENARWAIRIVDPEGPIAVTNNIIINNNMNRGGISTDYAREAEFIKGGNNIFGGSKYAAICEAENNGNGVRYTLPQWKAHGHDKGSFTAPLSRIFRNAGKKDFHLFKGSVAVGKGRLIRGAPDSDIDGVARPSGANHDIGAYELKDDLPGDAPKPEEKTGLGSWFPENEEWTRNAWLRETGMAIFAGGLAWVLLSLVGLEDYATYIVPAVSALTFQAPHRTRAFNPTVVFLSAATFGAVSLIMFIPILGIMATVSLAITHRHINLEILSQLKAPSVAIEEGDYVEIITSEGHSYLGVYYWDDGDNIHIKDIAGEKAFTKKDIKSMKKASTYLIDRRTPLTTNDLYGHGTTAYALMLALKNSNEQLRPSEDQEGVSLTGESGGTTSLNKKFVSTVSLNYSTSSIGVPLHYAENMAGMTLTLDNIDERIKEARKILVSRENDAGSPILKTMAELARRNVQRLEEAKIALLKLREQELYDEYIRLSKIPVCIIGDGVIRGSVYGDIGNESPFKRVNIRVVGVEGDENVRAVQDLLKKFGITDIFVLENGELKRLTDAHKKVLAENPYAETELVKMIKTNAPSAAPVVYVHPATEKEVIDILTNRSNRKSVRLFHKFNDSSEFDSIYEKGFIALKLLHKDLGNIVYFNTMPPVNVEPEDIDNWLYVDIEGLNIFDGTQSGAELVTFEELIKKGYDGIVEPSTSYLRTGNTEVVICNGERFKGRVHLFSPPIIKTSVDTNGENRSCGTICDLQHEGQYNALDEQLKRQFETYKTVLKDAGIKTGDELTENQADEALVRIMRRFKYMINPRKLASWRAAIRREAGISDKVKIFFSLPEGGTELFWVGGEYAAGHVNREGTRIHLSPLFIMNTDEAGIAHLKEFTGLDALIGVAEHEKDHMALKAHTEISGSLKNAIDAAIIRDKQTMLHDLWMRVTANEDWNREMDIVAAMTLAKAVPDKARLVKDPKKVLEAAVYMTQFKEGDAMYAGDLDDFANELKRIRSDIETAVIIPGAYAYGAAELTELLYFYEYSEGLITELFVGEKRSDFENAIRRLEHVNVAPTIKTGDMVVDHKGVEWEVLAVDRSGNIAARVREADGTIKAKRINAQDIYRSYYLGYPQLNVVSGRIARQNLERLSDYIRSLPLRRVKKGFVLSHALVDREGEILDLYSIYDVYSERDLKAIDDKRSEVERKLEGRQYHTMVFKVLKEGNILSSGDREKVHGVFQIESQRGRENFLYAVDKINNAFSATETSDKASAKPFYAIGDIDSAQKGGVITEIAAERLKAAALDRGRRINDTRRIKAIMPFLRKYSDSIPRIYLVSRNDLTNAGVDSHHNTICFRLKNIDGKYQDYVVIEDGYYNSTGKAATNGRLIDPVFNDLAHEMTALRLTAKLQTLIDEVIKERNSIYAQGRQPTAEEEILLNEKIDSARSIARAGTIPAEAQAKANEKGAADIGAWEKIRDAHKRSIIDRSAKGEGADLKSMIPESGRLVHLRNSVDFMGHEELLAVKTEAGKYSKWLEEAENVDESMREMIKDLQESIDAAIEREEAPKKVISISDRDPQEIRMEIERLEGETADLKEKLEKSGMAKDEELVLQENLWKARGALILALKDGLDQSGIRNDRINTLKTDALHIVSGVKKSDVTNGEAQTRMHAAGLQMDRIIVDLKTEYLKHAVVPPTVMESSGDKLIEKTAIQSWMAERGIRTPQSPTARRLMGRVMLKESRRLPGRESEKTDALHSNVAGLFMPVENRMRRGESRDITVIEQALDNCGISIFEVVGIFLEGGRIEIAPLGEGKFRYVNKVTIRTALREYYLTVSTNYLDDDRSGPLRIFEEYANLERLARNDDKIARRFQEPRSMSAIFNYKGVGRRVILKEFKQGKDLEKFMREGLSGSMGDDYIAQLKMAMEDLGKCLADVYCSTDGYITDPHLGNFVFDAASDPAVSIIDAEDFRFGLPPHRIFDFACQQLIHIRESISDHSYSRQILMMYPSIEKDLWRAYLTGFMRAYLKERELDLGLFLASMDNISPDVKVAIEEIISENQLILAAADNPTYMAFCLLVGPGIPDRSERTDKDIGKLADLYGVSAKDIRNAIGVFDDSTDENKRQSVRDIAAGIESMIKTTLDVKPQTPEFFMLNVILPYLVFAAKGYSLEDDTEKKIFAAFDSIYNGHGELKTFVDGLRKSIFDGAPRDIEAAVSVNKILKQFGVRVYAEPDFSAGYKISESVPIGARGIGDVLILERIGLSPVGTHNGHSLRTDADVTIYNDSILRNVREIGLLSGRVGKKDTARRPGVIKIKDLAGMLYEREFSGISEDVKREKIIYNTAVHETKHKWDEKTKGMSGLEIDNEISAHLTAVVCGAAPFTGLASLLMWTSVIDAFIEKDPQNVPPVLPAFVRDIAYAAERASRGDIGAQGVRDELRRIYEGYRCVGNGESLPALSDFENEVIPKLRPIYAMPLEDAYDAVTVKDSDLRILVPDNLRGNDSPLEWNLRKELQGYGYSGDALNSAVDTILRFEVGANPYGYSYNDSTKNLIPQLRRVEKRLGDFIEARKGGPLSEKIVTLTFIGVGRKPFEIKTTLDTLSRQLVAAGEKPYDWTINVYVLDADQKLLPVTTDAAATHQFSNILRGEEGTQSLEGRLKAEINCCRINVLNGEDMRKIPPSDFIFFRHVLYAPTSYQNIIKMHDDGREISQAMNNSNLINFVALLHIFSISKSGTILVIEPSDDISDQTPASQKPAITYPGTSTDTGSGIYRVDEPEALSNMKPDDLRDYVVSHATVPVVKSTGVAKEITLLEEFDQLVKSYSGLADEAVIRKLRFALDVLAPHDKDEASAIMNMVRYAVGVAFAAKDVLNDTNVPEKPVFMFIPAMSDQLCKLEGGVSQREAQDALKSIRDELWRGFRINNMTVVFYNGNIDDLKEKMAGYADIKRDNTIVYIDGNANDKGAYKDISDDFYTVRDVTAKDGDNYRSGYLSVQGHVVLGLGLLQLVRTRDEVYRKKVISLIERLSHNKYGVDSLAGQDAEQLIETLKKGDINLMLPPMKEENIDKRMRDYVETEKAAMKSV